MSEKRKRYTPAEKAKIALEAIKSEKTLAQISSKYGTHPTQINTWKKQAIALLPDVFSDKNRQSYFYDKADVEVAMSLLGTNW